MGKRHKHILLRVSSGFSLMEIRITLTVIGIVAAISAPAFMSLAPNMELKTAANELYATIQKAKVMSIKENRNVTLRFDTPGLYYFDDNGNGAHDAVEFFVLLDEDLNNNNTLDAGEDLNGNGILDQNYGIKYGLGSVGKDWNDIVCAPGVACDQSTSLIFNSRGLATVNPVPSSIFLENKNADFCYAVETRIAGSIKTHKYNGAVWD